MHLGCLLLYPYKLLSSADTTKTPNKSMRKAIIFVSGCLPQGVLGTAVEAFVEM